MPKWSERKISDSHPMRTLIQCSLQGVLSFVLISSKSADLGSRHVCGPFIYHVRINLGDVSSSPNDPMAHWKTGLWIRTLAKRKHTMTSGISCVLLPWKSIIK